MILLECCCGRPIPPDLVGCVFNHPIVMTNLIWAVVALVVLLVLIIKIINLLKERYDLKLKDVEAARKNEVKLKEEAFDREKFWAFFSQKDKPIKEELENVKNELNDLKKKEKDLDAGRTALENEKNKFEKDILEAKVKAYEEMIKNLD